MLSESLFLYLSPAVLLRIHNLPSYHTNLLPPQHSMTKAVAFLAALSLFAVACAQSNSSASPPPAAAAASPVKVSRDGTQLPSFGNCTCDLTRGSCDLFCCCDPSCSAANVAEFAGRCKEKIPSSVLPLCLSSDIFVKINANTLKDSPLCIERANSPLLGEFHPALPSSISVSDIASGDIIIIITTTTTTTKPFLNSPPSPSLIPSAVSTKRAPLSNALPLAAVTSPYTPGKLLTSAVLTSGTLKTQPGGGFFMFLQPGSDGSCVPGPVEFFANIPPATCYLSVTSSGTVCDKAALFSELVTNSLNSHIASKYKAPSSDPSLFRSITRLFRANVPLSNGSFTAPATSQCTLPVSITLRLQHDGSGSIVAAFTDEVHVVASSPKLHAPLQVSIEYVTYNPLTSLPPVVLKSGNPGYTPGLPVLAASISSGVVTVDPAGLRLPHAGDAFGGCLEPQRRASSGSSGVPVHFNVDAGAGCRLQLNQSYFDALCASSGTQAFLNMPGSLSIGRWGDASAANAEDWLPLSAPVAASTTVLTTDACRSMVTGLDVSIIYTASGLKSNPQFTILAATTAFVSQDIVRPLDASAASAVSISLSTTVTFVYKAPATSETIFASPPRVLPPLPVDIFYPFIMDSSAHALSAAAAACFAAAAALFVMF